MLDYIVVGFGLAGLHICHLLEKENKNFTVIDQPSNNASVIAGGVTNPLILKRFTKAWKADQFIPFAEKVYRELEEKLKTTFYHPTPIYRRIKSAQEQNDWFVSSDKPDLTAFMNPQLKRLETIEAPFGFGEVLHSSILDTEVLIDAYRKRLQSNQQYQEAKFDHSQIEFQDDHITYQNLSAKKIIFCEGYGLLNNPFFKELPLIGNKGEYLVIKAPELQTKVILKTALALIPLGNDLYKFGATYSRDFVDDLPEPETRAFLIKKLEELIDVPYEIISVDVGIRPTVLDRRPLLGHHPILQEFLVCNGFGSHGIMMAPTMAQWLLDFELHQKPLPKKVNLVRYMKKDKEENKHS